jgi:hypothetical protein
MPGDKASNDRGWRKWALPVLLGVGCVPFVGLLGLATFNAVSVSTYPTPPSLTVRNDTDRDVSITVGNAQGYGANFPPHRTYTAEFHPYPGTKLTTVQIDGPVPRICLWSDVHAHQPLVITSDGANCQEVSSSP